LKIADIFSQKKETIFHNFSWTTSSTGAKLRE